MVMLQQTSRLAGPDPGRSGAFRTALCRKTPRPYGPGILRMMQAFQPVEQVEDGVGHIWHAAASRGLRHIPPSTRRAISGT